MTKWAVGFFSMWDNVLTVEIVTANNWQDAVRAHSKIGNEFEFDQENMNEARQDFFDCDCGLDCVQIP